MADNAKTSKTVATKAGKVLTSPSADPTCKSLAGSALAQTPYRFHYVSALEQQRKRRLVRFYGEDDQFTPK